MNNVCETCIYFDNGLCTVYDEATDNDMTCKYWEGEEVSER